MAAEEFHTDDPVRSFSETWKSIIVDPRGFFAGLPAVGGLQGPLLFALACLAIGGLGVLVFGGGLRGFVAVVLYGLIRLFVGAALVSLVAQHLFDGQGDYEATFRVLAYSAAAAVAIGLPVIRFFAVLYWVYLSVVGLMKAHHFDGVRAVLTVVVSSFAGIVIAYAVGLYGLVARSNPLLW